MAVSKKPINRQFFEELKTTLFLYIHPHFVFVLSIYRNCHVVLLRFEIEKQIGYVLRRQLGGDIYSVSPVKLCFIYFVAI